MHEISDNVLTVFLNIDKSLTRSAQMRVMNIIYSYKLHLFHIFLCLVRIKSNYIQRTKAKRR